MARAEPVASGKATTTHFKSSSTTVHRAEPAAWTTTEPVAWTTTGPTAAHEATTNYGLTISPASLSNEYCHFYDDDAFDDTDRAGFRRRVIDGAELQLCFWRITGGATGSYLHHHDGNEQLGIIVRGALDFRIGDPDDDERIVLRAGDVYLAPRNVWHGDSVFIGDDELGECWILDVFAPPRADLRPGPRAMAARNSTP